MLLEWLAGDLEVYEVKVETLKKAISSLENPKYMRVGTLHLLAYEGAFLIVQDIGYRLWVAAFTP